MPFKVNGNSNYKLILDNDKVIKYSSCEDERLLISAKKQMEFKSKFFKTPKIYEYDNKHITMEYINGDSFYDFFIRASKRDLDDFIARIDGYFKERIIGNYNMPIELVKDKIKTFDSSIIESNKILDLIENIDNIPVKIGVCHGDLTLSNMIFTDDVYLIDFLDSYIESPTIDILKLRQDTDLYWSFNMINIKIDHVKLKIGLKYIDDWIKSVYDVKYYNLLQCINLYRIYRYSKDNKILEYLKNNINNLCEHL